MQVDSRARVCITRTANQTLTVTSITTCFTSRYSRFEDAREIQHTSITGAHAGPRTGGERCNVWSGGHRRRAKVKQLRLKQRTRTKPREGICLHQFKNSYDTHTCSLHKNTT